MGGSAAIAPPAATLSLCSSDGYASPLLRSGAEGDGAVNIDLGVRGAGTQLLRVGRKNYLASKEAMASFQVPD